MSYNNETAMVEHKPFILPEMATGEFSDDDLQDDLDGVQLSFTRVKIPSGGAVFFEIPGDNPDDPVPTKEIEGIILYSHLNYAYWPDGSEYDDNIPPLCTSFDGKVGCGEPGGACDMCMFNKYGTATDGKGNPSKGKACKNMRNLYILRSGEIMPIMLSLSPTSLKPYNDFASACFLSKNRPTYTGIVKISLRKVEGANAYSVAVFKKVRNFEGEELAKVTAYAKNFRVQIKAFLQTRTNEAMNAKDVEASYDDLPYEYSDSGEHFVISSNDSINGDTDDIPL